MKRYFGIVAAVGALAIAGVASGAHAQSVKPKPRTDASSLPGPAFAADAWGPSAGRKSLQWNADGRWGLKLDFDQPASREVQWKDVEAGAYYRLTPSLRVGGGVGLAQQTPPSRALPDEKPQPRVRLETTFRF
jgi:hypothetical protein